jgi:hypothetical protein
MNRWLGLLNLLQAVVYVGFALYLGERWAPAWAVMGVGIVAQLAAAFGLLTQRPTAWVKWASVASLAAMTVIVGLHVQVGLHIVATFTPVGDKTGWAVLGAVAAALPWAIFLPLAQLVAARGTTKPQAGAAAAAVLAALLIPSAHAQGAMKSDQVFAPQEGAAAAAWLWQAWSQNTTAPPPAGEGPVTAIVSTFARGERTSVAYAEGPDLASVLEQLRPTGLPERGAGIVLEIATEEGPIYRSWMQPGGYSLLRPGADGLRTETGLVGPQELWRDESVVSRRPGEVLPIPAVKTQGVSRVRFQSWIASDAGVSEMYRTWSAPQDLTADNVREAALAGALHIAENQRSDGRYAYVVQGPSGTLKGGYNYPRHAGGTWYLARVYSRTSNQQAREAALAGVAFMKAHTEYTADGRGFVLDPNRSDGKAWVGTTALALLAVTELGVEPELTQAWADFVASSVDERGQVRGDIDLATHSWPAQDEVTYAQGQGLLGLAAAERAGVPGMRAPLERAAAYVDDGYWPMPAARLTTLDEHWMCLAASAADEVLDTPAGKDVCSAYLGHIAPTAPHPNSALRPPAGPAAGLAEAVIARAELDRRAGAVDVYLPRAMAYGELLMENAYQVTDSPLLGRPHKLIGGFRDSPWGLDVRVDAVQHIGCALLGIEQLLSDKELPGAMP